MDRLLSNGGIDVWHLFSLWVPSLLGQRTEAVVSLDWTDFEADDPTTWVASLKTKHGRSTPLVWITVQKSALKGPRDRRSDSLLGVWSNSMRDSVLNVPCGRNARQRLQRMAEPFLSPKTRGSSIGCAS